MDPMRALGILNGSAGASGQCSAVIGARRVQSKQGSGRVLIMTRFLSDLQHATKGHALKTRLLTQQRTE